MPRLRHENCYRYRMCPACRRNDDAFEMAVGTFGFLILFTAIPITVVLVLSAQSLAGDTGMWSAIAFLASLPLIVGTWTWFRADRRR